MSQMTALEGFNALAQDVLPKLIQKIQAMQVDIEGMKARMDAMSEDIIGTNTRLAELTPVKKKRGKKTEAEVNAPAQTEPEKTWEETVAEVHKLYSQGMAVKDIAALMKADVVLISTIVNEG